MTTKPSHLLSVAVVAAVLGLLGGTGLASAPAGRYTIATDTVKDGMTGLLWQRGVSPGGYSYPTSSGYCSTLNLAGFSAGWRVPTKKELESLVDLSVRAPGPTIDTVAFPNTPNSSLWTSSGTVGPASVCTSVDFGTGATVESNVQSFFKVRCVR